MNEQKGTNVGIPLYELTKLCDRFGITKANLVERKEDFKQLIEEYFQSNPEFGQHKSVILRGIKYFLN